MNNIDVRFGTQLANALGLDGDHLQRIELIVSSSSQPVTIVKTEGFIVEGNTVATVLREYRLVPKDADELALVAAARALVGKRARVSVPMDEWLALEDALAAYGEREVSP